MSRSSSQSFNIPARAGRRNARLGFLAVVLGALALLTCAPKASAADASAGEKAFQSNCVVCHGQDGTGTPTGKALKAPDLHSDQVQKMTDAQIADQIANGKNNMPPFKNTLTKDQIESLVAYVRTFGKKK
jgi:mono/diheme cytochrome c family protein